MLIRIKWVAQHTPPAYNIDIKAKPISLFMLSILMEYIESFWLWKFALSFPDVGGDL